MIRLRPSGADEVLIKRVRDWYEPGPGVFIQSLTASFSPAMLFTGSITGAWYDPSDYTTLFQDSAGTTPVTGVEQPVGLMLDKSKGLVLGSELVTNGDFTDVSNWSLGTNWAISGGFATHTVGADGYITQSLSGKVVVGKVYKITTVFTGTAPILASGNLTAANTTLVNGSLFVTASGTSLTIYSNGNCSIDSISVRELPGNHAFNGSGNSANFPVLSARYNLLTKTEDFSDAVWVKDAGVSVDVTKYAAPDGTLTANRITFSGANLLIRQAVTAASGVQCKSYLWIKGTANQTIQIATAGTDELITLNGNWQLYTGTKNFVNANFIVNTYGGATARDVLVWHPDLRVANDALNQPTYQRVNTATDYDTVGFKPYLRFNGTNQWLQTSSIDFSYGDKMFVSAGVRKLSDAATGILSELSATTDGNNGSFFLLAPSQGATASYRTRSKGTASVDLEIISGYPAPITNVLSFTGNISAPSTTIRVNGTQVAQSTATQGTGNYGNYPLYIGARAGSSLWFNGRLYQMVVAGKQASAAEITSTETYLNQKTGAY